MVVVGFRGNDRFELVGRLGEGGMSVVYEALDRSRGCRVALKTMRQMGPEHLLRLKNEFRSLQDLHHPNLVSLYELCEAHGEWFFSMELVDGVNFIDYVRPPASGAPRAARAGAEDVTPSAETAPGLLHPRNWGPPAESVGGVLDEGRLRDGLRQLARGLNALHETGKVHRDIKPTNVLVQPSGRVVLLDLGLVTGAATSEQSTLGHAVGTAIYMAPEQAASAPVGPAADWYSVGAMLYVALTGQPPFSGATIKVMMDKQRGVPPRPRDLAPGVSDDLDCLCMALLTYQPERRPGAAEVLKRLGDPAPRVASPSAPGQSFGPTPFVGREGELAALEDAFRATRRGDAAAVLLEGESGVGKSALVRRFTEGVAARGAVVLFGRCYERESVPFKAVDGVIDALSRYMARLPPDQAAALLPRNAGLLGHVFPVLRRVKAVASAPSVRAVLQRDPQELRARLFGACRELLGRLADRHPLVLVIDDLQWADADSLALFAEILRPPEAPPLLAVLLRREAGPRDQDREGGEWTPFRQLPRDLRRLHLAPLPSDDAQRLAALLLDRARLLGVASAERIAAEAYGHPLFIDELVRHVATRGEGASANLRLDEALEERIGALPAAARRVLELTALAGKPVAQEVVARASSLEGTDLTRAIALLRASNLVQTGGSRDSDTITTYHDRVREAVVARLSDEERRRHHLDLALAWEGSPSADHEVLAIHWREAGDGARAAIHAAQAADAAVAALAFDHAAALYRVAQQLSPDAPERARALRIKLADSLASAGRGAEAAPEYHAAAADAPGAEALELRRRAAEQYLHSGHADEGLAATMEVLAAVGLKVAPTPARALAELLWRRALVRLRGLRYRERAASGVAPDELARLDICFSLASSLGPIDAIRGSALNAQALRMALRIGEPTRLARAIGMELVFAAMPGRSAFRRVEQLLALQRRVAGKAETPEVRGWTLATRGMASYYGGRFSATFEDLIEADRIMREECTGRAWETATIRMFLCWSSFYTGRVGDLATRVPAYVAEALDRGDVYAAVNLQLGMVNCAWLVPDAVDEARRRAHEAMARWARPGFDVQHWYELTSDAQTGLYVGDALPTYEQLAARWRGLERSLLTRIQLVRVEAWWLRARCALAVAETDTAGRARWLAEAARLAGRIRRERVAWSDAAAELILAAVAERRGRRAEAVTRLEAAVDGFASAQMALLTEVARRRLGELSEGQGASVAAADAWLARQGIRRPDRWVAMLAPGFGAA